MSMPTLPTGFTWSVELVDAAKTALIHVHDNGSVIDSAEVDVHHTQTEADFVAAIEAGAQTLFAGAERYGWVKTNFPS